MAVFNECVLVSGYRQAGPMTAVRARIPVRPEENHGDINWEVVDSERLAMPFHNDVVSCVNISGVRQLKYIEKASGKLQF